VAVLASRCRATSEFFAPSQPQYWGYPSAMASYLIIGPHPDDQELGMGGTISLLASQGHAVHLVDMTNGEPTPRGSPEIRAAEAAAAARVLGVGRTCLGLPNREVVHSVAARHALAAVIRQHRPETLFVPFPIDAHPDHVAVSRIAEDARFDAKLTKSKIPGDPWHPKRILYYYCTHLRMSFQPTFCVDISAQMDQKLAACACYASQFGPDGLPAQVKATNAYFGTRLAVPFAEPFFSHEVVGLASLEHLV
jgi:bacillithiol biosynthesis deacetylase BshB1